MYVCMCIFSTCVYTCTCVCKYMCVYETSLSISIHLCKFLSRTHRDMCMHACLHACMEGRQPTRALGLSSALASLGCHACSRASGLLDAGDSYGYGGRIVGPFTGVRVVTSRLRAGEINKGDRSFKEGWHKLAWGW